MVVYGRPESRRNRFCCNAVSGFHLRLRRRGAAGPWEAVVDVGSSVTSWRTSTPRPRTGRTARRRCTTGRPVPLGLGVSQVWRTALRYRTTGSAETDHQVWSVHWSRTPAVAEHLLGILRAGGVYCPIDAALPPARRQTLATVLGLDGFHPATAGQVVSQEHDADAPAADIDPPSAGATIGPCCCTSGSTGAKPVVVSRRA